MFENIIKFFKKVNKKEEKVSNSSKDAAKERLHLVLMQDRANVSADFLELMKQEIIDVIKKYIDVDESAIDVRLTNKENEDGTNGAPALYANIPILNIKNEARKVDVKNSETTKKEEKLEENKEQIVKPIGEKNKTKEAEKVAENIEAEKKEEPKTNETEKIENVEKEQENEEQITENKDKEQDEEKSEKAS